ncbi:hypothetical protein [Ligilactobacillus ruminis]|uniref:hypothetical protein n=1 Tax=Ligilactobacillus ruminis TaxID=1623 RepID=UPI00265B466E|nr:hypothetical protein [Ligilactobacillus ruminis]WKB71139.1 hypothetical protein QYH55_02040 [Ligilactobacillus ruminis]
MKSGKNTNNHKNRISRLDTIIKKLYKDNSEGKISDEHFAKILETYEIDKNQLINSAAELENIIDASNRNSLMQTVPFVWLKPTPVSMILAQKLSRFYKIYFNIK